ncbi:MAG TPA: hypothetical protein VIO33_04420 [Burkholderiaceae bacterium]
MQSFKFELFSWRGCLARVILAVVASLSCIAATLAVLASASGELDPLLAKARASPAASAVADKTSGQHPSG